MKEECKIFFDMTKEEAIKHLYTYSTTIGSGQTTQAQHEEAKRMAIKSLEQEPCEDAISREAVCNIINDIRDCISVDGYWAIFERLKKLPSVNPQPKTGHWIDKEWIPVSDRLPEKNVEVLATTSWDAVTIAEMYSANDWFIHEGATNAETDEIAAWMPLPEPYETHESEDKE